MKRLGQCSNRPLEADGRDRSARRLARGVLLAVLSLTLAACGQSGAAPATSGSASAEPPPGLIVTIGEDSNVLVVHPDGSGQIAITDDARLPDSAADPFRTYFLPTWSRDGGVLAYGAVARDATGVRKYQVETANADGSDHQLVFESSVERPIFLSWGPDGERLGVLTSGTANSALGLWMARDGQHAELIDRGQPYYWDWSSGGQFVAAHVGGSAVTNAAGARISVFRTNSGERTDWSLEPGAFLAPAGRPESDSVLVAAVSQDGGEELVIVGLDGEVEQHLAPVADIASMGWSPDGQRLAYVERSGPPHEDFGVLTLLRLNDSPLARPIPTGLDSVAAFSWSPTGDRLVALVPRVFANGGQQSVADRPLQNDLQFELYLVQADSGQTTLLTVYKPTEAFLEMLPFFDQYQRSSTMWSPDGRFLTFSGRGGDGGDGVYVIEAADGATASMVADGSLAFWSFR